MSRRRAPRWHAWLGAGLTGLATTAIAQPLWAQDAPPPVRLSGKGTAQLGGEIVGWQNAMFGAARPTDVGYVSRGSDEARRDLLRGVVDFAVSGIPFSEAELATKPSGAGDLISVPLSVASLSVVFTTPVAGRGGWDTLKVDQACEDDAFANGTDPEVCYQRGVFTGPFRIPPDNLAALMIGLEPSFQSNRLASWFSPTWRAALGTDDMRVSVLPNNKHTWVNRTEGSAANRYLLEYAKAMAPDVWSLATTAWLPDTPSPFDYQWEPVQSQMPTRSVTRFGSDTMIGLIAIPTVDVATGSLGEGFTGNAGAIPTTLVADVLAQYPQAGFKVFEIQNANGDWVAATKESIDAALAAGSTPNIAATEVVPGGYPLVWINHLYTFAGTLEPDQANALAATIRYIVTDGQAAVEADGGTALTGPLVTEALAAANQIVAANCPSATHDVRVGGPSAFEPTTPGVQALTGLQYCEVRPPPTTTTTVAAPADSTSTTTSTTLAQSTTSTSPPATSPPVIASPRVASTSPPTRPPAAAPPTSPPAATRLPETTTVQAVIESSTTTEVVPMTAATVAPPDEQPDGAQLGRSLSNLPFPLPADGSGGFKKLGTLLLGAAMFFAGRRLVNNSRDLT